MPLPMHLNVLVADDDEGDRILLVEAFKQMAWRAPFVVRDGHEVAEYLQGEGIYSDRTRFPLPDVLILDYWMPHLTGMDVLRWLRSESPFRTLPVVVRSSPLPPAQVIGLNKLNAAYGEKPIDCGETVEAIQRAVIEALSLAEEARKFAQAVTRSTAQTQKKSA